MTRSLALPLGMVSEPCKGLTVVAPDPVQTYFRTFPAMPQAGTLRAPPPELAPYRHANAEAAREASIP